MSNGSGGGGGSSGQRLFGHGLSVEELKEMTKIRLQHQQGGGRSSPNFTPTGRPVSSSGSMGGSLGSASASGGGGFGHERVEWRRSGSAGSAAMMEEHHRAIVEEGHTAPFRSVLFLRTE